MELKEISAQDVYKRQVLACVQVFTPLLTLEMQSHVTEALENSAFSGVLYQLNPAYILIG